MQERHDNKRHDRGARVRSSERFLAPVLASVIVLAAFLGVFPSTVEQALAKQNNNGSGGGKQAQERNPKKDHDPPKRARDSKPKPDAVKPVKEPALVPDPARPVEKPGPVVEEPVQVKDPTEPVEKPSPEKPDPIAEKPEPVENPGPVTDPTEPIEKPDPVVEGPIGTEPVEKPGPVLVKPTDPVENPGPVTDPTEPVEEPGPVLGKPTEPVEQPGSVAKPADPVKKSEPVVTARPAVESQGAAYEEPVITEPVERLEPVTTMAEDRLAPSVGTELPLTSLVPETIASVVEGKDGPASLMPLVAPIYEPSLFAPAAMQNIEPLPIVPASETVSSAVGFPMTPEIEPRFGGNSPPAVPEPAGTLVASSSATLSSVSRAESGTVEKSILQGLEEMVDDVLANISGALEGLFDHALPAATPGVFDSSAVGSVAGLANQVPWPFSSSEGGLGSALFFGSAGSGSIGSGSIGSGSAGGGLAVLAVLFILVPASGRLLRVSCEFLRPNSALCPVIERPG